MPVAAANDDDEGDSGRGASLVVDDGAPAGDATTAAESPGASTYTANDTEEPLLPTIPCTGNAASDRNEKDADDAAEDGGGCGTGPLLALGTMNADSLVAAWAAGAVDGASAGGAAAVPALPRPLIAASEAQAA